MEHVAGEFSTVFSYTLPLYVFELPVWAIFTSHSLCTQVVGAELTQEGEILRSRNLYRSANLSLTGWGVLGPSTIMWHRNESWLRSSRTDGCD
jgi:hypothetical protein